MRALLFLTLTLCAGSAAAAVPSGCKEDYSTCKEDCSIEYGGSSRYLKQLTQCMGDCQESLDLCADRHSSLKGLPPGVVEEARPTRRRREEPSRKKTKVSREEDPWADEAPPPPPRRRNPDDPFGYEEAPNAKGGEERRESSRASEARKEEIPPAPVTGARATSSRAHAEETVLGTSAEGTQRTGYRASGAGPKVSLGLEDEEPLDGKAAPVKPAAAPAKAEPVKQAPAVAAGSEETDPLLDSQPAVLPAPPPARRPATTSAPSRPPLPPEPKEDISEWDPNGD